MNKFTSEDFEVSRDTAIDGEFVYDEIARAAMLIASRVMRPGVIKDAILLKGPPFTIEAQVEAVQKALTE